MYFGCIDLCQVLFYVNMVEMFFLFLKEKTAITKNSITFELRESSYLDIVSNMVIVFLCCS